MNTKDAVAVLRAHNKWRRAEAPEIPDGIPDAPMPHSARDIGIAIDMLCDEIERLRAAFARIVTEVSDELPGDTSPTGIQTLAHTVAVIAATALSPNDQAQASREAASPGAHCSARADGDEA